VTAAPPSAASNSRRPMVTVMCPSRARVRNATIPRHERAVLNAWTPARMGRHAGHPPQRIVARASLRLAFKSWLLCSRNRTSEQSNSLARSRPRVWLVHRSLERRKAEVGGDPRRHGGLINVRFGALCGLKSDILTCQGSAKTGSFFHNGSLRKGLVRTNLYWSPTRASGISADQ